jgi:hypothetical protein
MGAHAIQQTDEGQQLALYDGLPRASALQEDAAPQENRVRSPRARPAEQTRMCAACRAREARYGFNDRQDDDPLVGRPNTLCFDCFRMEIDRRQAITAQLARGWNATQASLPLAGTLDALSRRRRRAQIAARHALEAS